MKYLEEKMNMMKMNKKMSGDFSECVVHQEPWRQSFKKGM